MPNRADENIKRCTPSCEKVYSKPKKGVHENSRRCTPFSIYERSWRKTRPLVKQNTSAHVGKHLVSTQRRFSFISITNLFTECAVGTWRGHWVWMSIISRRIRRIKGNPFTPWNLRNLREPINLVLSSNTKLDLLPASSFQDEEQLLVNPTSGIILLPPCKGGMGRVFFLRIGKAETQYRIKASIIVDSADLSSYLCSANPKSQ